MINEGKQKLNENLEQEIIDERIRVEKGNLSDPIICKNLEKEYIKDKHTL